MKISNNISEMAKYISEGEVVAFPTETVYGLGANAFNPIAVAKIYELKARPTFNPLIVHIENLERLYTLAKNIDERVFLLAKNFWPGPLTMILEKKEEVPDIITAGLSTVGVRMPDNNIALELISQAQCPIAAPSANKFGTVSPTTAEHIQKQFPEIEHILDGGKTAIGIESTIIRFCEQGVEILRPGAITKEELEKIFPVVAFSSNKILAPGMLKYHYAPSIPLYILGETKKHILPREKTGLISFSNQDTTNYKKFLLLSVNQDLKEYASKIFSAIHELQSSEIEQIVVEPVPEVGIGVAIMERLRKASFKFNE
jgi:L-threonylcarbamoyladenylate synthase